MQQGSSVRKRMGHVALFVVVVVVPVLAVSSLAIAHTGADPRPGLDDAQRTCLAEQGVNPPASGSEGEQALTQEQRKEQRKALRKSVKACGLGGPRAALRHLTDEQRRCLADQGVNPPARAADGTRPHVSAEERDALRQAAVTCGLPARGHHERGGNDQI